MTGLTDEAINIKLRERGIKNVLLTMVDHAGIMRVKLLPAARVPAAVNRGLGFSLTSAVLLCADDDIADIAEFPQAQGDVRLFADLDALRVIDEESGLAWAPVDQFASSGEPFSLCQRTTLKRQVERAKEHGLEFNVAFEIEFTLFGGTPKDPVLAHAGPAYGLTPILLHERWASDLLDAFRVAGIDAEQVHPEYGLGQFETSLRPQNPIRAVDEYILARIIVARVSHAHGLMVSFAPVAAMDTAGNGCHIHFSATENGHNVFADSNEGIAMTTTGSQLIAGLVEHLRSSVAMLAPSVNSYARLQPGHFSGAYVCWGTENREAAIRYIPGVNGRRLLGANVEVKTTDGAANPYLALATIMACSLQGVADHLLCPEETVGSPDAIADSEYGSRHIQPMPRDLDAALHELDGNSLLRREFGDSMIDSYVGIRKREWTAYSETPLEERIALLRWKY